MSADIRLATPADAPRLAHLRYEFRSALGPAVETEDAFVARSTPWIARRLAAAAPWRCWVAERNGEVAGHLWLQLIEKIPNPISEAEHHAYITNVYVRPEARGGGIGNALVATALAWCRQEHVDSVILWPTERSRSLYARHGFAVRDNVMVAFLEHVPLSC